MKPRTLIFVAAFGLLTALNLQAQDLSRLSYNDLVIAAQSDAKQYFASHQPIVRNDPLNNDYAADIGIALASSHNLVGANATVYSAKFFQTLDALVTKP
jgi:hypothetical protein